MQRLRAVVKTFKADPVCQALLAVGVDEVYVEEVQGYGRQKGHLGLYRQPAYGISFLPKIAITAYLPDELVEKACAAIEAAAATGTIGDGKIFLTPVDYAIPQSLETVRVAGASAKESAVGAAASAAKSAGKKQRAGAEKATTQAAKKDSAPKTPGKKPAKIVAQGKRRATRPAPSRKKK
jgi:nitrogen regulatory protein PII